GRILLTTATLVVASLWALRAQEGVPGQPSERQTAPAQGRGRGNPAASLPTPRLADGTVNFGRVPGEKGIWNVPYITNMGMRLVGEDGKPLAPQAAPGGRRAGAAAGAPLGGGEGTAGGGRGGAKAEPWVPFQPWAAAVYD